MPVFDRLRFDNEQDESPRVKESRISVIQIYEMHVLNGATVDAIAAKFDALDRESVEQAIRYAVSHPDTIRRQATSELTKAIVERQGRVATTA